MTHIVVNDASCLIDLRKGRLLHFLCHLPHRFIVPLPVRESELLDFTSQEQALFDGDNMETYDLPPERMEDVFALKRQHSRLSANDCICLVTTQYHENGILLTIVKAAMTGWVRPESAEWAMRGA
ncbi:MAG: type II toxin-antitoxin system VapC family toxin [Gammaproteobacteria bacterium]|nr:type II toxin-antitoxin system VapC family toxin [Gammaproteobacteria bacterium]